MKSYQLTGPDGLDALQMVDANVPDIAAGQVLVAMKAWSLNFRDTMMPLGGYPGNDKVATNPPLVPLSDGVGEVIAIGDEVTRFQVGDRVAGIFFGEWLDGDLEEVHIASALGGATDGVLAEQCVFNERSLVKIPDSYSYAQAATLPCAAVTAWQALTLGDINPEQTLLLMGTGGVSIFALQMAKAYGAKVIITSSSDEKLAQAKALGADLTINYGEYPEWQEEVLRLTDGKGVDHVVEVGGAGTLEKSMMSAKTSGRVSLIGVLTGMPEQNPSPYLILFKRLTLQGIYVGSRKMFEDMNRFLDEHQIKPVIDREFGFDQAREAFEYMSSAQHLGKIIITR